MNIQVPKSFGPQKSVFKVLRIAGLILLSVVSQAAVCKEHSWYRYESPYFIANSNASHKTTLAILTRLEMFRVAVSQVANLRVPASAVKTEVLILRTRKEFKELGRGRNTGAYAVQHDGKFLIVMPASGDRSMQMQIICHEYSHVLLGYSKFDFPRWYNEGFAELSSTIRFIDKDTAFTFGEPPPGLAYASDNHFDWNTLISEGWDNSSLRAQEVHNAYMESWLLAHYVTLGDDFKNTPKLHQYFELIEAGQSSLDAFEQAFGMDGNELWVRKLRRYNERLFALVYDFRTNDLHTDFQRSDSDPEAVLLLLEEQKKYNSSND